MCHPNRHCGKALIGGMPFKSALRESLHQSSSRREQRREGGISGSAVEAGGDCIAVAGHHRPYESGNLWALASSEVPMGGGFWHRYAFFITGLPAWSVKERGMLLRHGRSCGSQVSTVRT